MEFITQPARKIKVIFKTQLCVLGGSQTGVFAAVRAARLGTECAVVEQGGCFGGVATAGMVNCLHTLLDDRFENQIIGGLTDEILKIMRKNGDAISHDKNRSVGFKINSQILKILLDRYVTQHKIKPFLHTKVCDGIVENGVLRGVVVETVEGPGVILADAFIDATGDAILCDRLGLITYKQSPMQPPTACSVVYRFDRSRTLEFRKLWEEHSAEFDMEPDWGWSGEIPGCDDLSMLAENHIFNCDCSKTDDLTKAEMEGRRKTDALLQILRKYADNADVKIAAMCDSIGVRQTRQVKCLHKVTMKELLTGEHFADAVLNGTYRVDVHHEGQGISFYYLDGTKEVYSDRIHQTVTRWADADYQGKLFYQMPYRSMVPDCSFDNLLIAGRCIDADNGAFGALRVMVNTNQMGEAAGVAAHIMLDQKCAAKDVPPKKLRELLQQGGSIVL